MPERFSRMTGNCGTLAQPNFILSCLFRGGIQRSSAGIRFQARFPLAEDFA
jgi:hypothetical protein